MEIKRYAKTNEVHARILKLAEEINELAGELIMDGTPSELEVNAHLDEIEFIINDSIEHQITLIKNLIK